MAGGRDDLGLGVGVLLALEGDLGGVGPHAVDLAGGRSGHLVGNSSVHRLHVGGIIAASKGGRSGEVVVPLPHRLAIGMAGSGDSQILQSDLGGTLGIAEQLAADVALPVSGGAGDLAGGRHLCHGGQGVALGGERLRLGVGVLLALKGDLSGIGAGAANLAAALRNLAGHSGIDLLHMGSIISAGEGGRSGEIIVPLPHRRAIGMTGGRDGQILQSDLGGTLGIAEQLAADVALPVSGGAGGLAGGRHLCHSGQGVALGGNRLRLGVGVVLALKGDLSGIGTQALLITGGLGGHFVGDGGRHRLGMAVVIRAGKDGGGGEIIVPGPSGLAIVMVLLHGDGHAGGGDLPLHAGLAVLILILLPLGGLILQIFGQVLQLVLHQLLQVDADGDLGVIRGQGIRGVLEVVGHVLGGTVGIMGGDLQALGIKGIVLAVGGAVRLLGDLQLRDTAAQPHQLGGVVLKVDVTLFVHNGAANGVLRLRTVRGKEHIGRLDGVLLAVFTVGLHGGVAVIHLRHAGHIPDDPQLTGGEVIEEIDVVIAVLVLIGRGQQTAGLRIAHGGYRVGDGEGSQVYHRDIVAGIGLELAVTGHTDVSTPVGDHGGGGTHGRRRGTVGAIIQMQATQRALGKSAVGVDLHLIQVAALGGEVIGLGLLIVADAAAEVAHVGGLQAVNELAGLGVQGQDRTTARDIPIRTVIGGHQHEVAVDVSTGPIEAVVGIGPGGELGLGGLGGILIGDREAGEVGLLGLAVPEARVDIAVCIGDGAVGLAAQRIPIDPKGLQRLGIEGLHPAIGKTDKDHALGVGGGVDGKGGAAYHGAGFEDQAGLLIHLHDGGTGIGIEVAAHDDGAAHSAAAVALAQLVGPHQNGVLSGDGGAHIHHAVVFIVLAEQGPVGGQLDILQGAVGGLLQLDLDGLVGLAGGEGLFLAHIAVAGHHCGVAAAAVEGIGTFVTRQDAVAVDVAGKEHRGITGGRGDGGLDGSLLIDLDGVGPGDAAGLLVGDGNRDGLRRRRTRLQGDLHGLAVRRPVVLIIGDAPAPVAAGHSHCHICIHPVGGQGPQGQAQLRGFFADIGGVVIHQLGKGGLGGVAALIQGNHNVVLVLGGQGIQRHGAVDVDEVVLIQGSAVDRLGLGYLQAGSVAIAAHGHELRR